MRRRGFLAASAGMGGLLSSGGGVARGLAEGIEPIRALAATVGIGRLGGPLVNPLRLIPLLSGTYQPPGSGTECPSIVVSVAGVFDSTEG